MKELAILYRAAQFAAHQAHQEVCGESFFSDHAYLGELYETYTNAYDSLIERMIGCKEKPDILEINKEAMVEYELVDCCDWVKSMYKFEADFQKEIETLTKDKMSQGSLNLLAQLADESEVRSYKLGQRMEEEKEETMEGETTDELTTEPKQDI